MEISSRISFPHLKKKYRVSQYFLFTLNQLIELFVFTVRNNTKVYKHTHDEIYMTQVRIQLINSGVGVQIITPGALRFACVLKISFSYLKKTTKVFINTLYIYMKAIELIKLILFGEIYKLSY